jgi:hypothetical protein
MMPRALVMVVVVAIGSHAAAQDADELAMGRDARASGDHDAALAHFTAAWDHDASATARAEMGLEELALGRFASAETHLTEALALGASTELAARVEEIEAAQREAASHLGSLDIACPSGCEVRLDGELVGLAPLGRLVRAAAGAHVVLGTLADHRDASASIEVAPGAVTRVELSPVLIDRRPILERIGPAAFFPVGVATLSVGLASVAVGGVLIGVAVDRGASPDASSYWTGAIATLIVGGVLSVVGAVFLGLASAAPSSTVACSPAYELGASCALTF